MCILFKLEQLIALETGKREEVQHHFKTMKWQQREESVDC